MRRWSLVMRPLAGSLQTVLRRGALATTTRRQHAQKLQQPQKHPHPLYQQQNKTHQSHPISNEKDQSKRSAERMATKALARKLAQRPGEARTITASIARLAARASQQRKMDGYSESWRYLQKRARALVDQYEEHTAPERRCAAGLAAALSHTFAPATVAAYFSSAVAQRPEYRDAHYRGLMRGIEKRVAAARRPRVAPMTALVRRNLAAMPTSMRLLCALQAVTGSRHADVLAATMTHAVPDPHDDDWLLVRFEWTSWKSDPLGRYFAEKWARWPKEAFQALARAWATREDQWEYESVWRKMNAMTPHDLRRWALTTLAPHLAQDEVLVVTQHAQATKGTAHVRRYTEPTHKSTTAQVQIRASQLLWDELGTEFQAL
jgi:hypothetical protein